MFLSNTHNFILFSIPKTGTTSMLAALRATLPWVDPEDVSGEDLCTGNFCPRHRESSILRKHTMPFELRRFMNDELDRYFKFAFVRNPWDWVVSNYFFARSVPLDVLRTPDGGVEPFLRVAREARARTFVDFVRWQSEDPTFGWVFHSFLYGKNCEPLLDFVGRFETMQVDFDFACRRVGLPRLALDRLNPTSRGQFRQYYDTPTQRIVAERFAPIIASYDYDF